MIPGKLVIGVLLGFFVFVIAACGDDESEPAQVAIENGFEDPVKWTICKAWYNGVRFEKVERGLTSPVKEVEPGLGYVYAVGAWDDPSCQSENALPLATKNEEEVVEGQTRTIVFNLPNHLGACPPEGVQPLGEGQYNRVLELFPDYDFLPYDQRTQNTECLAAAPPE